MNKRLSEPNNKGNFPECLLTERALSLPFILRWWLLWAAGSVHAMDIYDLSPVGRYWTKWNNEKKTSDTHEVLDWGQCYGENKAGAHTELVDRAGTLVGVSKLDGDTNEGFSEEVILSFLKVNIWGPSESTPSFYTYRPVKFREIFYFIRVLFKQLCMCAMCVWGAHGHWKRRWIPWN